MEMNIMSDLCKLIDNLSIPSVHDSNINVFWEGNVMYLNDVSGNQFQVNMALYYAWKFSKIFHLDFDYTATDEQVFELGKNIVTMFYEGNEFYLVDIDDYIDNIKSELSELLKLDWDFETWQQVKRSIVQEMEENISDINVGGSATFIAKWLNDLLNSALTLNKYKYSVETKECIETLIDEFLQTDNYDITAFADTLKKIYSEK